jgi:glycosyltransferase involved in cell wall biosynthesis
MTPLVSVVIPTKDRRPLLARAVAAARSQQDVELEVVVVDDGSADGTTEFVRSLDDANVRGIRHDTARGVSRARNAGIEAARGEWVALLDDDDVWAPDKLAIQLRALEETGADWACTGAVAVDPALQVLTAHVPPPSDVDVARLFLAENRLGSGASCVVARTSLFRQLGGFDGSFSQLADHEMWIRLALGGLMVSVARPLIGYVVHPGAMSQGTAWVEAEYERMLEKHRAEITARGVEPKRDYWWRWVAEQHARAGRRRAALAVNARIFRHYRHWSWLPMAAAMAVTPAVLQIRERRYARNMPEGWREEADAWLRPLRIA